MTVFRRARQDVKQIFCSGFLGETVTIITRKWAMANGRTFKIRPIREFVEEAVQEVDVCAGGVII